MSFQNFFRSLNFRLLIIFSAILFVFSFFIFSTSSIDDDKLIDNEYKGKYGVYPVDIPENIDFAGEYVPLSRFDVYEALDREFLVNTFYQSQTLLFIKKSRRFLPVVENILKDEGVPSDFKYLPFIESGYSNPTSPAGAVGYWQFLKGTAIDYGLEVNDLIDERYHLEKSTIAACKFLKESYEKYGSWTLAAASYNMGRKNLSNELERQKATTYYDLLLSEETSRYVFRILAVKSILENPEKFGFHFKQSQLYPVTTVKEVFIDSSITHFADFANIYGISYKELKYYNPWLRNHFLTNSNKKEYIIKIPEYNKLSNN